MLCGIHLQALLWGPVGLFLEEEGRESPPTIIQYKLEKNVADSWE